MDGLPPPDQPVAELSPVRIECVLQAAEQQRVPLAALVAIMAAEGGRVGRVSINTNDTYDIGPMQINSSWLDELAAHGVTEGAVVNNGCVNVLVGAWILGKALVEKDGDIWEAIGRYHSGTPHLKLKYQKHVYEVAKSDLDLSDILERANGEVDGA